ncbi:hypothetical protein [Alteromonas facilis]|uniref:hypothetical protein n=1 Tax=Alteromonas facilis TaxID=2048004 RepID=UPI000C28F804|nr:hypothetical protein [Alteromonas facilis]
MNATAIAIVAIICWTLVKLTDSRKSKKKDKAETDVTSENAQLRGRLDAMQERIEVLERIVTDEKYDLNRQFDNLRKDSDRAA